MGVKLQSSSGGSVEIAAPVTASNYVLTAPAATDTLVGEASAQTLTNKTLTSPTIDSASIPTVSGTAPLYMCRAWVNFNGTGTVAIRASGNVSSITDNGTGDYTVNFTTAMPDANYAVHQQQSTGSAQATGSGITPQVSTLYSQTTSSVRVQYSYYTGSSNTVANNDGPATWASVSVFR